MSKHDYDEPIVGLLLDIETIANPSLRANLGIAERLEKLDTLGLDDMLLLAEAEGFKLGNAKKQEAVYKAIVTNYDKVISKAALKLYGCCIYAIACCDVAGGKVRAMAADHNIEAERTMILDFFGYLESFAPVCLMGFNVRGFDIPVLRVRCMMLDIPWPDYWPQTRSEDKYDKRFVFDAQDVLDEGTLNQWLLMSGIPPKTSDGGRVADMSPDEVQAYCAADVDRERQLMRKILPNVRRHRYLMEITSDE